MQPNASVPNPISQTVILIYDAECNPMHKSQWSGVPSTVLKGKPLGMPINTWYMATL